MALHQVSMTRSRPSASSELPPEMLGAARPLATWETLDVQPPDRSSSDQPRQRPARHEALVRSPSSGTWFIEAESAQLGDAELVGTGLVVGVAVGVRIVTSVSSRAAS